MTTSHRQKLLGKHYYDLGNDGLLEANHG